MLYFNRFMSLVSGLFIVSILASYSSHSFAKRPHAGSSSTSCLSGKAFNSLAKNYLLELQQVDPSVTLSDVKTVLKTIGYCGTTDQYDAVIAQYSAELNQQSITDTTVTEPGNTVPVISGTPQASLSKGEFYLFTPVASDADNDALLFSVQNLPGWARFDEATGTILGIPMDADVGLHADISITVSDGVDSSRLNGFSIEVQDTPAFSQSALLGEIASYSIHLGTSVDSLPNVIELDIGGGGQVQTVNSQSAADTYYLAVIPRDGNGNPMVLPSTEIAGFRIYIGTSLDDMGPLYNFADGTDKIYWVNSLQQGSYYVALTTYDVYGNETALSNIAQFDIF